MKLSSIIIGIYIVISLITVTAIYAEQEVKTAMGYMQVLSKGAVTASPVAKAGYELKSGYFGIEAELEAFMPKIKEVNTLYCSSISAIPKVYINSLYLGYKVGYIFNTIGDNMDADDEVSRGIVIGNNFDNWFIEGQLNIADLDIETNLTTIPEPKIEQYSRLNNWQILIGKRIKF